MKFQKTAVTTTLVKLHTCFLKEKHIPYYKAKLEVRLLTLQVQEHFISIPKSEEQAVPKTFHAFPHQACMKYQ